MSTDNTARPTDHNGEPLAPRDKKGPISWMARNPVAANLLMLGLLVGGFIQAWMIKKEVFPRIAPDEIEITVPYPGASPAEVEQGILLAIEEAVYNLDGVKEVRARAREGVGNVTVELTVDANKDKALADVKNAVDRITSFPNEIERPIVLLPEWRAEAIYLVVFGETDEKVLHTLAEQVREELLALPEISAVELNVRPLEISIEVPSEQLRTYGLTLAQIANTVRRTAIELPAGGVKTTAGEVLLRTAERRNLGKEFRNIPVVTGSDGSPVLLGQIADINDGFAETDFEQAFDGKPAVLVQVYALEDQSPTDVAEAAKRYVKQKAAAMPPGTGIQTWFDRSKMYDERLDLLVRNAGIGLFLVLLLLGLFLEPKLAFWVMMGIPISFLGSLILLPAFGVSINMISLFGFIVTLGIVVDDAIVVGENAFRFRRQGMSPFKAAVRGAKQVSTPVFFSVATTIVAFTPLLMLPGIRGKIMVAIPVIVILVLFISLLESFFILPAHLSHSRRSRDEGLLGLFSRIPSITSLQGKFSRSVERFIERFYLPVVRLAVRQRWISLALGVVLIMTFFGMLMGGRIKTIDFPREESDWVIVEARMPFGTALDETRKVMKRLVDSAQSVIDENGGQEISTGIFSMLGFGVLSRGVQGGHVVSVFATLVPTDQREIGSHKFAEEWRKKLGDIPGLESITFDSSTGHSSKPIDLELSHSNIPELEAAARELAELLTTYEGVKDIDNGIELGKPQLDFKLSPQGSGAGLTSFDIASQVRSSFYGAEAFRQQRGRHELKVMVRLPREERETLKSIEEMMIITPTGGEMPLRLAANVEYGRAYTGINRTDGRRTLRVQAEVEEGKANAAEVIGSLFKGSIQKIAAAHPGLQFGFAGRQRDRRDFNNYLMMSVIVVLLIMTGIVAIPLKSFSKSLLVIVTPALLFGTSGALLGHLLMGMDMSMISWMGVLALFGVAVNDSIVLVSTANRFLERGMSPTEAATRAAQQRFRPILLTSLTTFGGLAPMIFETSLQARVLIPMAVSLGFGILFMLLIVFTVIPALYVLVENMRVNLQAAWNYIFPKETPAEDLT